MTREQRDQLRRIDMLNAMFDREGRDRNTPDPRINSLIQQQQQQDGMSVSTPSASTLAASASSSLASAAAAAAGNPAVMSELQSALDHNQQLQQHAEAALLLQQQQQQPPQPQQQPQIPLSTTASPVTHAMHNQQYLQAMQHEWRNQNQQQLRQLVDVLDEDTWMYRGSGLGS
jgi:hypothetical protein